MQGNVIGVVHNVVLEVVMGVVLLVFQRILDEVLLLVLLDVLEVLVVRQGLLSVQQRAAGRNCRDCLLPLHWFKIRK